VQQGHKQSRRRVGSVGLVLGLSWLFIREQVQWWLAGADVVE